MSAPIIYVADAGNLNSFMLRLQSVQGPDASLSATVLARKALTALTDAGLKCTARVPGSEGFLRPIKKEPL